MMCSRHRPLNGADAEVIYLGTSEPIDPRLSMLRVMQAYEAVTVELERGNVGEVVYLLRGLSEEEHDLVEDLLAADGHRETPPEPSRLGPQSERGQALIEFALVGPLLLLIVAGGLVLGLAIADHQARTWHAQEAAYAAATAGAEDSACLAAIAAATAVSGRSYAACDGSDGLSFDYAPPVVTITIAGGSWPVPFLDTVDVSGSASAMLRPPEPSPAPSEVATP